MEWRWCGCTQCVCTSDFENKSALCIRAEQEVFLLVKSVNCESTHRFCSIATDSCLRQSVSFLYSKYHQSLEARRHWCYPWFLPLILFLIFPSSDFFIPDFLVVIRHYEVFQGCWKLIKSFLKSASLIVLTLQDFQSFLPLLCSSLGSPVASQLCQNICPWPSPSRNPKPRWSFVPWLLGKSGSVATCKRAVPKQLELNCTVKDPTAAFAQGIWGGWFMQLN